MALAATVAATAAITLPGPHRHPGRTLVLSGLALAAYGVTLWSAGTRRTLPRRLVLTAAVAGIAMAVVAPPVGSTDTSAYAVYGRMVTAHHASPYTHVPADFPGDPWYPRMAAFWHHTGSVYGPGFTAVSAAAMAWAGTSALKGRLAFQLLAAAALLGALALVDRRTRGDPAALAFVGLNPVLVAGVVNGGHNDVLVGLAVLAGAVLLTGPGRIRPAVAGAVVALGALVKLVALLALAAMVAWALCHLGRRAAARLAAAGGAVTLLGYLLAGGATALGPLEAATGQQQLPAAWAYPRRWLTARLVHHGSGAAHAAASAQHTVSRLALATVVLLAAVVVLARLRARSPVPPTAAALLAYLLAGAYVMPWYTAWALPALALRRRSRLAVIAAAHAGVLLLATVDRPSQLSGAVLVIVRFLRDTALPGAEVAAVAVLVVHGVRRLARTRQPARSPA
jgi:hypothetical protein